MDLCQVDSQVLVDQQVSKTGHASQFAGKIGRNDAAVYPSKVWSLSTIDSMSTNLGAPSEVGLGQNVSKFLRVEVVEHGFDFVSNARGL